MTTVFARESLLVSAVRIRLLKLLAPPRLSLYHKDKPYSMHVHGQEFGVEYWPGDSRSGMFGGNSNWRGPIWLAVNFLLIESLQRFHQYYGDSLQVECPTGSGEYMNLGRVGEEIQHRLIHIFGRDIEGRRATNGGNAKLDRDPHFRDYLQFYEVSLGGTFGDGGVHDVSLVLQRKRRSWPRSFTPDWMVSLNDVRSSQE